MLSVTWLLLNYFEFNINNAECRTTRSDAGTHYLTSNMKHVAFNINRVEWCWTQHETCWTLYYPLRCRNLKLNQIAESNLNSTSVASEFKSNIWQRGINAGSRRQPRGHFAVSRLLLFPRSAPEPLSRKSCFWEHAAFLDWIRVQFGRLPRPMLPQPFSKGPPPVQNKICNFSADSLKFHLASVWIR